MVDKILGVCKVYHLDTINYAVYGGGDQLNSGHLK